MEQPATFWMMQPLRKYATFTGRARRAEYWWFYLLLVIVSVIANVIDYIVRVPLVGGLVSLALLLPSLAVQVRRLHDTDRSGWWILLPLCLSVPLGIGFAMAGVGIASGGAGVGPAGMAVIGVTGIALLAVAILFLVWFCSRGTVGDNRFGPDPLATDGGLAG